MKAGRELDALIAEKIMGEFNNIENPQVPGMWGIMDYFPDGRPVLVPNFPSYSSDISAAWEVVEQLRGVWDIRSMSKTWVAILSVQVGTSDKRVGEEAETAPLAICLAALKAVEV